jgi:N utilization substance protein B
MMRRSRAREVALQLLFQHDLNKVPVPRAEIEQFARERLRNPQLIRFCLALYDGVLTHLQEIDRHISLTADNWRLSRMLPADRNVLRLGSYELLFDKATATDPTPVPVIINEAVELARRFGTADSSAFVNGVLDKIAQSAGRTSPSEDFSTQAPPPSTPVT